MCHWSNNMIAGLTSGIKSSSSLGKVTGTLSLVLAQAPTLRIFIDTCNEDFKHHTLTAEETLHLAPPSYSFTLIKSSSPSPLFSCPGPSVGLWTGCSGLRWLWCLGTFAITCLWSLQASQPVLRWKTHRNVVRENSNQFSITFGWSTNLSQPLYHVLFLFTVCTRVKNEPSEQWMDTEL